MREKRKLNMVDHSSDIILLDYFNTITDHENRGLMLSAFPSEFKGGSAHSKDLKNICCILLSESTLRFWVVRPWGQGMRRSRLRLGGEGGTPQTQEPCFFLACWLKLPALRSQESTNMETANTLITCESGTNSGQTLL